MRADPVVLTVAAAVLAGGILRLRAYAADRSLWLDESFLAINLLRRSFGALLGELDFNQGAAPGFLLLEKSAASIDTSELMLRLVPLVFGLVTIGLVVPVARRVCSATAVPIACALTALAPSLVYYSSELKQYSGDVAAFSMLVWAALELRDGATRRQAVLVTAIGGLAVVISQPAVFVAAGVGAVLLIAEIVERGRPGPRTLAAVSVWAVTSAAVLAHALRSSAGVLRSYEGSASFAGTGGASSSSSIAHSISLLPTSVAADLGLPTTAPGIQLVTYLVGLVGVAGLISLLRRRAWITILVATPILVTVAVSVFGHYPISGRTVLFVVPAAALLIGEGIVVCARNLPARLGIPLGLGLAVLAFQGPVRADARTLVSPTHREEVRPVLREIAALERHGDRVFVAYAAQYALAYYGACGCSRIPPWPLHPAAGGTAQWAPALRSTPTVEVQPFLGPNDDAYLRALRQLRPGRTWVLLSHVGNLDERRFLYQRMLAALDRRGRRLTTIDAPGAEAVLYDLR
jgi:hypothetical protein